MTFRIDMAYLAVVGAVGLRCAVLTAMLPLFDQRSVPVIWRLVVAVTMALAVSPLVAPAVDLEGLELGWTLLVGEAARSLLVGALLAFAVGLMFATVRYAGQVVGMQIGFAIVNTIDPQNGLQISVLSQLYYLLAVLLFFAVDGHHTLMMALVQSCQLLPLFGPVSFDSGIWYLVRESSQVFRIGLKIAAPCVVVLLLVSATMGVVVRTVPQLNVLVVGFPVKIAAGLLVIGLSLTFFRDVFLLLLGDLDGRFAELLTALL